MHQKRCSFHHIDVLDFLQDLIGVSFHYAILNKSSTLAESSNKIWAKDFLVANAVLELHK